MRRALCHACVLVAAALAVRAAADTLAGNVAETRLGFSGAYVAQSFTTRDAATGYVATATALNLHQPIDKNSFSRRCPFQLLVSLRAA